MINYTRSFEPNMPCELYLNPNESAPARLDDFQVFRRGTASHIYGNYYTTPSYDSYAEPDIESSVNVYHNLVSCRGDYYRDEWKKKFVVDWTEDDTVSWIIDEVQYMGISEYEVPFQNFRVSGVELQGMKREDIVDRMMHPNLDPMAARRIADTIYEKLCNRLNEDVMRNSYDRPIMFRYPENDSYQQPDNVQTVLDLDSFEHRSRVYGSDYRPNDTSLMLGACDSSDDAVDDDVLRSSGTASPEYGSDGSNPADESTTMKKRFKRPPGRPKGSGRKVCKRPRSISVPEFIRSLLNDHPSIIRWEDRSKGKFRFLKPDQVAKLWGMLKQNENMTFEKFSRAMRYHYKQLVLLPVPDARLVYQFGPKGPDYQSDKPVEVKTEDLKTELQNYT